MNSSPLRFACAFSLLLCLCAMSSACSSSTSTSSSAAPEKGVTFEQAQQTVNQLMTAQREFKSRTGYFANLDTLLKDRSIRLPPTGKGQDGWGYVFDVKSTPDSFQITARCYAPTGKFCSELVGDHTGQITMNIKPGQ